MIIYGIRQKRSRVFLESLNKTQGKTSYKIVPLDSFVPGLFLGYFKPLNAWHGSRGGLQ